MENVENTLRNCGLLVTHNTVLVDCSDSRVGSGPIYIGDIDMSRLTSNVGITVKTVDIYIYISTYTLDCYPAPGGHPSSVAVSGVTSGHWSPGHSR